MRNLKVSTKLFLLIGIFIIGMVTLTSIVYFSMNSMAKDADVIYKDRMVPQANFLKYRANNRAMETIVFQIMQVNVAQDVKKYKEKFEELSVENMKYLDSFQMSGMSEEEMKLVNDIKAGYPAYLESLKHTIVLAEQDKEEASAYFKSEVMKAYNVIQPLSVQLEKQLMDSAEALNQANTEDAQQSILLTIIISVVLIVICIGVGIWITRLIVKPIQSVQKVMKDAERGDFTGQVNYHSRDELGQLTNSLNSMMTILKGLFGQFADTSQQVAAISLELSANAQQTSTASEHIASNVQKLASGAELQVQAVEETVATLKYMGKGVQHIAQNAQIVSETAIQTSNKSLEGNQAIELVVQQMNSIHGAIDELGQIIQGLNRRSDEIGAIIEAITGIASQTNLLALNAAIEASRAAEHGKGFAVVASEVRKLAEQSAGSAKKVSELISTIQLETGKAVHSMERTANEVFNGIKMVTTAGQSFELIQQSVNMVAGQIQEVTSEVQDIASGTEQMLLSVEHINQAALNSATGAQSISVAAEEQLASMEEISSSSSSLSRMADELQDRIKQFKI
ncbi:methyl-accepting chemotaxis protein [Paenibacillus marinisediminis]